MTQASTPMASGDLNKAYGAGGSALIGGAVAKIAIRILNVKWPGFLDEATIDAVDTLFVAGAAGLGAWAIPHRSNA